MELSENLKEKALAYLRIRHYGLAYYIPITKEMKKQYHLKLQKGKIIPTNWKEFDRLCVIIQTIVDSIYLQVRDVVCAGIESHLDSELKEGFSKLFEKYLHKRVKSEVVKRLLNK